jgi:hypothetical protein
MGVAIWAATSRPPTRVGVITAGVTAGSTQAAPTSTTTPDGTPVTPAVGTTPPDGTGTGSTVVVPPPTRPGTTTGAAPSTTTTTHPGPATGTTTVTEADSGRSYSLHRGDRLVVNLSGPAIYTWTEPASSNGAVLARASGSSGATASAVFVAAVDGPASVSATDSPNCYPQCLPPTRLFQVNVSVTG